MHCASLPFASPVAMDAPLADPESAPVEPLVAPPARLHYARRMRAHWLQRRKTRLLVGLLLLPALAARLMVPQGFMPGTGADDAPTMQMCHGAGPMPAATHPMPAGDGPAPGQGGHHEAPCVFAAAGTTAPPPVPMVVLGAAHAPDVGPPAPEFVVIQRALHRSQSARAPPTGSLRA